MEIEEGTICAKGKNSLAKVVLFKMDDIEKQNMKTENGIQHPSSHFAYVPDAEKPSTWKLRLYDDNGDMTPKQVGMAVAALGEGFRGNKVDIPADELSSVKSKVRAAWKKVNPDANEIPSILKSDSFLEKLMEDIIKAGKQISTANMEKIKAAMKVLHDLMGMSNSGDTMNMDENMQMACDTTIPNMKKGADNMDYQELTKSLTAEQIKLIQMEIEKQAQEAVKKLSSNDNTISKQLEDMQKSNIELAKALEVERDLRITKEFIDKAKSYKNLPIKADEFGKILKDLFKRAPEEFAELEKVLAASDEMINKNNIIMEEIGVGVHPETDAMQKMNTIASEIQKANSGMTFQVAFSKAMSENPELYNEYRRQKQ